MSGLGLQDLAEGDIVNIAVDRISAVKLRVIEGIEGFEPKLQRRRLFDPSDLAQSHVIVVDSGSIEDSAVGGAEGALRVRREQLGVEGIRIIPRIVINLERAKVGVVVRQIVRLR